jgi:hypothetical protein
MLVLPIRICMDPHHFRKPDLGLHPHQNELSDPGPHPVKNWILIWIRIKGKTQELAKAQKAAMKGPWTLTLEA